VTFQLFKVIQDHWCGYQSKARMRLPIKWLLVHRSNLGPLLHRFGDFTRFCAPEPTRISP